MTPSVARRLAVYSGPSFLDTASAGHCRHFSLNLFQNRNYCYLSQIFISLVGSCKGGRPVYNPLMPVSYSSKTSSWTFYRTRRPSLCNSYAHCPRDARIRRTCLTGAISFENVFLGAGRQWILLIR